VTTTDPSSALDTAPAPLGGKQTEPDPRRGWAAQRARLGGYEPPVAFTEEQQAVLNTAADLLIPPGGGFPAPSEVEIVAFVARYVTPASEEVKYFPLAAEYTFKDHLGALGREFLDARPSEQIESLRALESGGAADAAFFEQLKGLVYYGYYARPEVTAAIRKNLSAGRDYHGPPQPYGYLSVTEQWNADEPPHGRGHYIATDEVRRVDIPEDLKSEYGVQS
jgi:hypothetical protein